MHVLKLSTWEKQLTQGPRSRRFKLRRHRVEKKEKRPGDQRSTKPKEQAATLIMLVLFHTLEKVHHHSRNYQLSGVVVLKV